MCPAYLTFVRDRRQAPVYDDHFGHVRAEYNVNYAQWSLGPHMRRVDDDNETMLRYSLIAENKTDSVKNPIYMPYFSCFTKMYLNLKM